MTPSQPTLDRALDLVRFLRANCDWDAAQTPDSLIRYLLEEAHETAEAIRAGSARELTRELGDLLLNLAFQIVIAEENGTFTAEDVSAALEAKMRRRHPHLYGDGPRISWDEIKRAENDGRDTPRSGHEDTRPSDGTSARAAASSSAPRSLLDGIDTSLPPLTRAHVVQARVAEVGFDWPHTSGAFEKVREEVEEVGELLGADDTEARDRLEDEIGDLLFATVNLARLAGIDSTTALRRANAKFSGRFRELEREAAERGVVLGEATLEELDAIWDQVKRRR